MPRSVMSLCGLLLVICGCSASPAPSVSFETAAPRATAHPQPTASPAGVVVYVAGDVQRPGVYHLAAGRRVVDAVRLAGDAKPDADLIAVNLAEPLRDGAEIAVPAKGERIAARGRPQRRSDVERAPRERSRTSRGSRRSRKRAMVPAAPIDLNTADASALAALPGVGAGLAERIVQFREANGPFDSVDELADVSGITDHRLEALAPYLTIDPR
jgi:competence protein ComEA